MSSVPPVVVLHPFVISCPVGVKTRCTAQSSLDRRRVGVDVHLRLQMLWTHTYAVEM